METRQSRHLGYFAKWLPALSAWVVVALLIPFHNGELYGWLVRAGLGLTAIHAIFALGGVYRYSFWYNLAAFTVLPLVFDVATGFWITPVLLILLLVRSAMNRRIDRRINQLAGKLPVAEEGSN